MFREEAGFALTDYAVVGLRAQRFARTSRLRSLPLVEKRRLACPGVVLDLTDVSGKSGFAFGYAVTGFVLSRWSRTKPGAGAGSRPHRQLRYVALAEGVAARLGGRP